ncbi:hypothetical protein [uncultured Campylobacter sp.]|nr:hypothetical protein [uncultured Campylobacter sp.]
MKSQTKERFSLAALLGIPIGIMPTFCEMGRGISAAAAQSQRYI